MPIWAFTIPIRPFTIVRGCCSRWSDPSVHDGPKHATTTFRFDLPRPEPVRLELYDLMGRRAVVLRDAMPAGRHSVDWDGRDASGSTARPGAYLYRLTAGSFRAQRKLVVLP